MNNTSNRLFFDLTVTRLVPANCSIMVKSDITHMLSIHTPRGNAENFIPFADIADDLSVDFSYTGSPKFKLTDDGLEVTVTLSGDYIFQDIELPFTPKDVNTLHASISSYLSKYGFTVVSNLRHISRESDASKDGGIRSVLQVSVIRNSRSDNPATHRVYLLKDGVNVSLDVAVLDGKLTFTVVQPAVIENIVKGALDGVPIKITEDRWFVVNTDLAVNESVYAEGHPDANGLRKDTLYLNGGKLEVEYQNNQIHNVSVQVQDK